MTFALINIALRLVLMLCTVLAVVKYGHRMNLLERLGAGIAGGSALLTIPLIWDIYKRGTYFDGWASCFLNIGFILGFCGLMWRLHGHEVRNRLAIKQAKRHWEKKA